MNRNTHDLNDGNGILERRCNYHRDIVRDLVIAALDRVLDGGFTHGPWLDELHNNEQCVLVSSTRSFTLSIGDVYDELSGLNSQDVATRYDIDELLDNDKLVEEERETLAFGGV